MCPSALNPTPNRPISLVSASSWGGTLRLEVDELAELSSVVFHPASAQQVAQQLMAKDALGAHARDELGISEITTARPVQAALTSAATFSVGAAMPLLMVVVSPAIALVAGCFRCVSGLSCLVGSNWGKGRWGKRSTRHGPGDVLGRPGDGSYRRNWQAFRDNRLKMDPHELLWRVVTRTKCVARDRLVTLA